MRTRTQIALSIPGADISDRYFALQLKDLCNERSDYCKPNKILVISDIEGNFMAFLHLLLINKVIDKHLKWTFEDGHLMILGDCFDRGEQVTECLWLIYSLEEKARKKGGYVHFVLGNHEIMNLNGDWRYIHPKYASSPRIPYTALYNGNDELWQWLCTKNIIEKIGDILFVHGGIAEVLLKFDLSVAEINNLARPYYSRANELFADPLLNSIFNSEDSPFWFRGYYQAPLNDALVDATLAKFGVSTIVTGHTVMDHITPFFSGKVINVDTDHSSGKSEGLLIKRNKFYRVDKKGKKEKIK